MNYLNKSKEELAIKIRELQTNYNAFNKTFDAAIYDAKLKKVANRKIEKGMNTKENYDENYYG